VSESPSAPACAAKSGRLNLDQVRSPYGQAKLGDHPWEPSMTTDDLIVSLIIAAFLVFGVVLFWVSIYVRLGECKPAARLAARSAPAPAQDHAVA
jgi:hypothetical protein